MAAGRSSSYGDRVARQFEQRYGRSASADDAQFREYAPTAMSAMRASDKAALERTQRNWMRVRNAAYAGMALATGVGVAGALSSGATAAAGGAGSAGGTSAAAGTAAALPSAASGIGTTAGYGSLFGGGAAATTTAAAVPAAVSTVAPTAAAGAGLFRMSDLARYGIPAAGNLITNHMSTRASERGSNAALEAQQRQFDATQQWLRDQEANAERRHRETEDEKKRQWDADQAEKKRQWEAKEPWRASSRANLTRMSGLMDGGPGSVAYQPTFRYRP